MTYLFGIFPFCGVTNCLEWAMASDWLCNEQFYYLARKIKCCLNSVIRFGNYFGNIWQYFKRPKDFHKFFNLLWQIYYSKRKILPDYSVTRSGEIWALWRYFKRHFRGVPFCNQFTTFIMILGKFSLLNGIEI